MRPTRISRPGAVLAHRLGPTDPSQPPETPPPPDCCNVDPADIPDRANEDNSNGAMVALSAGGAPSVIQTVVPTVTAGVVVYPIQPTPGNTIVMVVTRRDSGEPSDPALGGWTTVAKASNGGRSTAMWYRVVTDDESGVTSFGDDVTYLAGASGDWAVGYEITGAYASVFAEQNDVASTTAIDCGGTVAAPDSSLVIAVAAIGTSDHFDSLSMTPDSGVTEVWDANFGGFAPAAWSGYRSVSVAASVDVGGTYSHSRTFAGVTAVFGGTEPAWTRPANNVADGNDATYIDVSDFTDLLRVDLGGPFRIVRTRIRIAGTTAGARTFTIKAATQADFSDEVTIDTFNWTAVGSLTAQDVEATWYTDDSYQYWELDVDDADTYRLYTWSLYEATLGQNHEHDIGIITTDETDTDLVLHPDGTGGVEWGPGGTVDPDEIKDAGRWELAVVPGSPPDSLYADGDWLYIWVPG